MHLAALIGSEMSDAPFKEISKVFKIKNKQTNKQNRPHMLIIITFLVVEGGGGYWLLGIDIISMVIDIRSLCTRLACAAWPDSQTSIVNIYYVFNHFPG